MADEAGTRGVSRPNAHFGVMVSWYVRGGPVSLRVRARGAGALRLVGELSAVDVVERFGVSAPQLAPGQAWRFMTDAEIVAYEADAA